MNEAIDLRGLKTDKEVFQKFGEVFEFCDPQSDQTYTEADRGGWGQNWDAFNDCLGYLDVGGISGNSKKFDFPLTIEVLNSEEFQKNNPKGFSILKDILERTVDFYKREGKLLQVII